MKKESKVILIVFVIGVILYGIMLLVDINRTESLKEPIFAIKNGYVGSMIRYDGLGYKIGLETNLSTGHISYGQLSMLGKIIVRAIE